MSWLRACLVVGAAAAFRAPARGLRAPRTRAFVARDDDPRASDAARVAVLCSVPVVWGTYAPAVKAVYALPAPPPGAVFSLFYYVVVGLETVSADAAAFLVQLTTVLVPVLESAGDGRRRRWSAAAARRGLFGRARRAPALGLATAKAGWEAAFALGGVAFLALATPFEGGGASSNLFQVDAGREPRRAAVRCAARAATRRQDKGDSTSLQRDVRAPIWAQSFGQRGVAPSRGRT
ncbi:pyrimidine nucleotide-sugar transmembrane transporter [Aureococcus anophagefferens]|uniref:Pyrimidine nucleotide-sugar transmembrane transporter n=1 Tax=Aureococcus anophagefferens TaxID=44056 RepID=A0ABR1G2Z9_AURAN